MSEITNYPPAIKISEQSFESFIKWGLQYYPNTDFRDWLSIYYNLHPMSLSSKLITEILDVMGLIDIAIKEGILPEDFQITDKNSLVIR